MSNAEKIRAAYARLPDADKRVVRFYLQLPLEHLEERGAQFGKMGFNRKNNELFHQSQLYAMAVGMKKKSIPATGGKRKTRKQKSRKQRFTRRG